MIFPKTLLQQLAFRNRGEAYEGYLVVQNMEEGSCRWSINCKLVFQATDTGLFYMTSYQKGATEMQDESPFEYDIDLIECPEAEPVQVTRTMYVVKGFTPEADGDPI